jgi:hypothetical protein
MSLLSNSISHLFLAATVLNKFKVVNKVKVIQSNAGVACLPIKKMKLNPRSVTTEATFIHLIFVAIFCNMICKKIFIKIPQQIIQT